MKNYDSKNIKNVAVVGHASKGKTTLCESLFSVSGAIEKAGSVAEKSTVMDYDSEEKKRGFSISCSVASTEYKGTKINFLDTPGLFDFEAGEAEGLRAAETAVIVVSARSGLAVGAEKAFKNAGSRRMARIFALTKMDDERADFYKSLNEIVAKFGTMVCPVVVPVITGGKVVSYYNMLDDKAYAYDGINAKEVECKPDDEARFEAVKSVFAEAVAGTDENLLEKYFDGEALTFEDKVEGLKIGVSDGSIIPVFACSGLKGYACDLLLDFICEVCPSPKSEYGICDDEPVELKVDSNEPLAAICFKSISDPFIGKLSYVKVVSGKLTSGSTVLDATTGKTEKVGKIVSVFGAKQYDETEITAGDIGAVFKMFEVGTGDTLCASNKVVKLDGVAVPNATYEMAVEPAVKGEEEKVANGLSKLAQEDSSVEFLVNNETHQQIIKCVGEQQLDVIVSKLKAKYAVDVNLVAPKIAYKETITKKVSAQGRHKKQSGGHGQFGDVWIEFEPYDCEKLEFSERIVGGAVPKNYFPAVEKGLNECMEKGVLAGFPMVGVKATLYDGSYHPVDSNELSFKTAASIAYKEGIPKADPVILEPVLTVNVLCNDDATGDVIGDINKRRGRVIGMNPLQGGMQEILSEIPEAELLTFSTAVRQFTQGRGSFKASFARYEKCPAHISQKIIAQTNA